MTKIKYIIKSGAKESALKIDPQTGDVELRVERALVGFAWYVIRKLEIANDKVKELKSTSYKLRFKLKCDYGELIDQLQEPIELLEVIPVSSFSGGLWTL